MSDNEFVLLDITDGIARVTLNRPDKFNAFDDAIIATLSGIFDQLAADDNVRAMVLAGNGKHFSAGGDLKWMQRMAEYSFEDNLTDAQALAGMLKKLNDMPKPTIARVNGVAFAGAVGLVSCCDMVVAEEKSAFCISEVKIGLIPATIAPYVIDAIGARAARRYFQTAERFSVQKAQQLGLVSEIVPADELDAAVDALLNTVLANSPQALSEAKRLIRDVAYREKTEALINDTSERIAAIRVSEEGQEGLTAFFEKRAPRWQEQNQQAGE
jgi:methylglutaconyl-CoA hydratase